MNQLPQKKKLPEDFKQKWVEALRSGEYKQGDGFLENNGTFCCLGVACKVAGEPTLVNDGYGESILEFIPISAKNVPEMLRDDGEVPGILSSMNDGDFSKGVKKHSFSEIADYIEKNL